MPVVRSTHPLRCVPNHSHPQQQHHQQQHNARSHSTNLDSESRSGYSSSCQASVSEDNISLCRSSSPLALTPSSEQYPVGTIVKKYFHGHGWCSGVVLSFSMGHYKIHYEQSSSGTASSNPPKECHCAPSEMTRLLKTAAVEPGTRLEIYWPQEQRYHKATVKTERPRKRENYLICYDETKHCTNNATDREWIDLHRHKFRILDGPSWKIDFSRLPSSRNSSSSAAVASEGHPKDVLVQMIPHTFEGGVHHLLDDCKQPIASKNNVCTRLRAKTKSLCSIDSNSQIEEGNDQAVEPKSLKQSGGRKDCTTNLSSIQTEHTISPLDAVSSLPTEVLSKEMLEQSCHTVSSDFSDEKFPATLTKRIGKDIITEFKIEKPKNDKNSCRTETSRTDDNSVRNVSDTSPFYPAVTTEDVTTGKNDPLVEPDDSTSEQSVSALIADGVSSEVNSPCGSSDSRSMNDFGFHDLPPILSQCNVASTHTIKVESKSNFVVSNDHSHVVPNDTDVESHKKSLPYAESSPATETNTNVRENQIHSTEANKCTNNASDTVDEERHVNRDYGDDEEGIIIDSESDPTTRVVVCSLIEIGSRVAIYWPGEEQYYSGTVTDRRFRGKPFYVEYDDGEEEWIDLRKMKFRLLQAVGPRKDESDNKQRKGKSDKPARSSRDSAIEVHKSDNITANSDQEEELPMINAPSRNGRKKALDALLIKRKSRSSSESDEIKRSVSQDKPTDDFSKITVGSRVAVWWDGDKTFYSGVVQRERAHRKSFYLVYDDGEEKEWIDLRRQKFKLLPPMEKKKRGRPRKECNVSVESITTEKQVHRDKENAAQLEETLTKQNSNIKKENNSQPDVTPKAQSCDSKKRGRPKKDDNFHPDDINEIQVGSRVSIWWSGVAEFYEGTVSRKRAGDMPFYVVYDGDEPGHWIDFSKRTFRLLDKSSDIRKRQKLSSKEKSDNAEQIRECSGKAIKARYRMGPNSTPTKEAKDSDNDDKHIGASRLKDSANDEHSDGEFSLGITVGSRISVFWEGDSKYYEGVITRERKNSKKRHYLEYNDGEAAHWIDLKEHWVRVLPDIESTDTSKTRNNAAAKVDRGDKTGEGLGPSRPRQGKKSENHADVTKFKVGARVKIWWSGDQLYYPGVVHKIEPKRYFIEYDDGGKSWVRQQIVHSMTKADEEALLSESDSSDSEDHLAYKDFVYGDVRRVRVGSRLAIWWPSEKKYFNGTVKKMNDSRTPYFVKYDDGDEESTDLRRRYFRFLDV